MVLVVMAAVHRVQWVVLMVVVLVVVETGLRAERLLVGGGGGVAVWDGGLGRRQEDKRAVAHVLPLGTGDVGAAVAAGVSQVAVGALREDRKLGAGDKRRRRFSQGEDKSGKHRKATCRGSCYLRADGGGCRVEQRLHGVLAAQEAVDLAPLSLPSLRDAS